MPTFHGTIEELKELVSRTGRDGQWEEKPNNCWRFCCRDRSGLNWSVGKGTIWFDGPQGPKAELAADIESFLTNQQTIKQREGKGKPNAIFVVHGHDSIAREQLELVLHKLGLQPFVLQNTR